MAFELNEINKTLSITGAVAISLKIRATRKRIESTDDVGEKLNLISQQNEYLGLLQGLVIASVMKDKALMTKLSRLIKPTNS